MNNPFDGGAAFPTGFQITQDAEGRYWRAEHLGMSLRDYFAAMAMQGMNANPELLEYFTRGSDGKNFSRMAAKAYEQADAMLKERKEQRG